MRLKRVGGDGGVVAPHLVQENLTGHRPLTCAVKIFQDRRFLLRQTDPAVAGGFNQQLGGRTERIRTDLENGVLAVLENPQLGAQTGEKLTDPEGLGNVIVGTRIQTAHNVVLVIGAGQDDYRHADAFASQFGAEIAPVTIGESDIQQHGVITGARLGEKFARRGNGRRLNGFQFATVLKLLRQKTTQRIIIVNNQNGAWTCHNNLSRSIATEEKSHPQRSAFVTRASGLTIPATGEESSMLSGQTMASTAAKGNSIMAKAILKTAGDRAFLHFQGKIVPALTGRRGLSLDKVEGDLCTPVGELPIRRVLYRADRTSRPVCGAELPVEPIAPNDGWCDDPAHPAYNRAVSLPHPASCETLWREDHVYDLCIVMGWNDSPAESGRGSAIFLHLPPASGYTEGCIAVEEKELRALLRDGLSHITVEKPS